MNKFAPKDKPVTVELCDVLFCTETPAGQLVQRPVAVKPCEVASFPVKVPEVVHTISFVPEATTELLVTTTTSEVVQVPETTVQVKRLIPDSKLVTVVDKAVELVIIAEEPASFVHVPVP